MIHHPPEVEELVGRRPAHYDANAAASAGLYAGLIAALAYLALRLGADVFAGAGPWVTLRGWSVPFLGAWAAGRGFALMPVLVGLGLHAVGSLVFGLAFGLVAFGWQRPTVIWASLVYGFLVYGLMSFVVLPDVHRGLARAQLGLVPLLAHALFGIAVGFAFEELRFRSVARAGVRHPARTLTIAPHTT